MSDDAADDGGAYTFRTEMYFAGGEPVAWTKRQSKNAGLVANEIERQRQVLREIAAHKDAANPEIRDIANIAVEALI